MSYYYIINGAVNHQDPVFKFMAKNTAEGELVTLVQPANI